jgi:phosphodiesterase/alkaline phosphatase D-like protein
VKYFNAGKAERASTADEHHGYLSHRITPEQWTTEVRQVANITDASAPMSTVSTWAIEAGRPGPQEA